MEQNEIYSFFLFSSLLKNYPLQEYLDIQGVPELPIQTYREGRKHR